MPPVGEARKGYTDGISLRASWHSTAMADGFRKCVRSVRAHGSSVEVCECRCGNVGAPLLEKHDLRLETTIVMGTMGGCYGADLDFYRGIIQGDGPSPTMFAYTLPTIALGEVAIRHRLGGASYCFMAGADSGLLALWESAKLLEAGECQECVCIMADVLPQHAEKMARIIDLWRETPDRIRLRFSTRA